MPAGATAIPPLVLVLVCAMVLVPAAQCVSGPVLRSALLKDRTSLAEGQDYYQIVTVFITVGYSSVLLELIST